MGRAPAQEGNAVSTNAHLSGARLSTVLYDTLKGRLLDGRYRAGEKIVVESVRHEFGVSKQPVMDALRRLSSDGLVSIVPQVGIQVVSYTRREVEDFFTLFGGFEGTIAGVAALRRTDEQLRALDAVSEAVDELIDSHDGAERSRGYRARNREFHAVIHDMAHSRIMAETSHRMWDLSDFLINTTGADDPLSSALVERQHDHRSITDAIRMGDARLARVTMEQHIVDTVAVIGTEEPDSLTG
ncbi:GntR family transcriptional regulator [Rhodococcus sp. Leaf225]|nr:GntR family transcriptional regulator [Rhodococcus sp. Leaf225]KQU41137.1 GntR family transcriptional regulator [Rhodococcus sp. Leaf258]